MKSNLRFMKLSICSQLVANTFVAKFKNKRNEKTITLYVFVDFDNEFRTNTYL